MIRLWFKSGTPWVWLNAAAVSASLIMVIGVLGLILVRGAGHFWPSEVIQFSYQEKDGADPDNYRRTYRYQHYAGRDGQIIRPCHG